MSKLTVVQASSNYMKLCSASKQAYKIQQLMYDDLNKMETVGERFAYLMEIRHFITKNESSP